jgi:preprotein translocase subunit SecA
VQQAETARAQQSSAQLNPAFGRPAGTPGAAGQEPQQTGAFGQKTPAAAAAPINRAQRRAQEKKGQ